MYCCTYHNGGERYCLGIPLVSQPGSSYWAVAGFHPKGGQNLVQESEVDCDGQSDCSLRNCHAEHLGNLLVPNGHCRYSLSQTKKRKEGMIGNFRAHCEVHARRSQQSHCCRNTRSRLMKVLKDRSRPNGHRSRVD